MEVVGKGQVFDFHQEKPSVSFFALLSLSSHFSHTSSPHSVKPHAKLPVVPHGLLVGLFSTPLKQTMALQVKTLTRMATVAVVHMERVVSM